MPLSALSTMLGVHGLPLSPLSALPVAIAAIAVAGSSILLLRVRLPFSGAQVVGLAVAAILVARMSPSAWLLLAAPASAAFGALAAALALPLLLFLLEQRYGRLAPRSLPAVRPLHLATSAGLRAHSATQAPLARVNQPDPAQDSERPLSECALPHVPAALRPSIRQLIAYIMRDFVRSWHSRLLPPQEDESELFSSNAFPRAVEQSLFVVFDRASVRLQRVDLERLLTTKLLPVITEHVADFRRAEIDLHGGDGDVTLDGLAATGQDELFLAKAYRSGHLHPAVSTLASVASRPSELRHLSQLVDRVLRALMPAEDYACTILSVSLRDILTCTVTQPLLDMLSDPDFINQQLSRRAGDALQEQHMVERLRHFLDQHVDSPSPAPVPASQPPRKAGSTGRYEALLQSIGKKQSIVEVRQLRNDLEARQRKVQRLLDTRQAARSSLVVRSARVSAHKIQQAINKADQRIADLGGHLPSPSQPKPELPPFGFDVVLHNSAALSYFMEFEERRNKSPALQFWLVVNTFKDPLEIIDTELDEEDQTGLGLVFPEPGADAATVQTLRDDLQLFLDEYLSSSAVRIHARERETIQSFLRDAQDPESRSRITSADVRRTRYAVLRAQSQVYAAMKEEDWPAFSRSELYHQARQEWARALHALPPAKPYQLVEGVQREEDQVVRARPVDQKAHAELFGQDDEDALFGQMGGDRQAARKTNLDYLTAIQTPGNDGRPSLFSDNLFGDTDPLDHAPLPEARGDGIERMDAIQTAIQSLISSDHPEPQRSLRKERRDEAGRPIVPELQDAAAQKAQMAPQAEYTSLRQLGQRAMRLEKEEELLDSLLRNAQNTGATTEQVRVIQKSQRAVARELAAVSVQRRQAEEQRTSTVYPDRLTPGLVRVLIQAYQLKRDADGREYALYLIEVHLLHPSAGEREPRLASGWIVQRRYSEFWALHQSLKDSIPAVRALEPELPGRRLVPTTSPAFLDQRRAALEHYLQLVMANEAACASPEVRAFLRRDVPAPVDQAAEPSAARSLLDTFVKSATGMAEGLDELINPASMFDAVLQQLSMESPLSVWAPVPLGPAWASLGKRSDAQVQEAQTASATVLSISDLFIEVFELQSADNWLRRQAVVIVLQQLLAGTIQRRVADTLAGWASAGAVGRYISMLLQTMWPGGQRKPAGERRQPAQKAEARERANEQVSTLVPELAANMIGRQNARRGVRCLFAMVQNQRLNKHLFYTLLDHIVDDVLGQSV